MLKDFREFLLKQNALALAIGVIIGAATGKVVSSIADNVISPIIGELLPGGDWRAATGSPSRGGRPDNGPASPTTRSATAPCSARSWTS